MESIRDHLLNLFERFADNDDRLIDELENLIVTKGQAVYPLIFQILTNLDLIPGEAEKHWRRIIANRTDMKAATGRDVSLITVVCDYFCSINRTLHSPKIIEISLYEKATRSSTFDSLTNLLNRNTFDEALKREISRAKRYDSQLSLLFFDIDDFKKVNDSLGHLAGDEVLKEVARLIMSEKRSEDIAARYGGEEITLLLPETGKADAWMIGERIRKKIADTMLKYEGQSISITLSGGLASFPIDAGEDQTLLKNADLAMYRAKSFGKNNISFYSMDKRKNVRVNYCTEVEIRELGVYEKPVISAVTKSLSIGGVLLECKTPIETGAKIQINITLEPGNPLIIIGTVVRSKEHEKGLHEISIAFLDSNKMLKDEISTYLIKHMKNLPRQEPTASHVH